MFWLFILELAKLIGFGFFLVAVPLPAGYYLSRWLKKTAFPGLALSLSLGLLFITLETFIIGTIGLYHFAVTFLLIQSIILWLAASKLKISRQILSREMRYPKTVIFLIIFCVFINSLLVFPFGEITDSGISLPAAHFIDSMWHISLINSLSRSIPPENPLISGTFLTNYHYLAHLQIALIGKFTHISIPDIYFHYFGILYLALLAALVYNLTAKLSGKILAGKIALILTLTASNLYYFIPLLFPRANVSPSVMWVDFFSTKVINYPLLISIVLILCFLDIINQNKLTFKSALVLGFLSGGLFLVKSQSSIIWLLSFGLYSTAELVRRSLNNFVVFISSAFCSYIFFQLTVSAGVGFLIFTPLWFIKVMFESPEHLNYVKWELQRQTLISLHAYLGVIKLYFEGLFLFLILNFGPLLVGFIKPVNTLYLFLVITSVAMPLLFITQGTAWNSIQFIYLAFIPLIISTSVFLVSAFQRHQTTIKAISLIFIGLLLPGCFYTITQYQNRRDKYDISPEITNLIRKLVTLPQGAILADQKFWTGWAIQAYSGKSFYTGNPGIMKDLVQAYPSTRDVDFNSLSCKNVPHGVKYILVSKTNLNLLNCSSSVYSSNNIYLYLMKT